jgi:hypothetical protein
MHTPLHIYTWIHSLSDYNYGILQNSQHSSIGPPTSTKQQLN